MLLVPIRLETGGAHTREIRSFLPTRAARPKRAAASVEFVTSQTVRLLEVALSLLELREIGNAQVGVAAAAAGEQIGFGEHRFRPMGNLTVGISDVSRAPLSTVANRAAVSGWLMNNVTMTPVETVACDTILARRHPCVATDTTIRRARFAADDLA